MLLSLVLALGARVVYAAPAQATAELTAVSHCTQHTGRPSSVPAARQCCEVRADADAPAATPAMPSAPASQLVPLPGVAAADAAGVLALGEPAEAAAAIRDGPPRYLALRSIRR
ncbi:MAG TPA: hypothetical protein VNO26_05155 [Candidatus Limnocylindria bacterium]|nr:hypothetical protein [Candidatus Limnocylindria bacterium]